MFCGAAALASGQSHTIAQDGWVTVTAQHGGAACILSQPARAPLWEALAAAGKRLLGSGRIALGRYRSAKPV